jgi:hypothetical protein
MKNTLKFLIMFAVTLAVLAVPAFGQTGDAPKHVIAVTATYSRADFNIKDFQGEARSVDADRDSPGFDFNYTYYPTSSPLTVGMSTGASFENREINEVYSCGSGCVATSGGTSKIAKAYFQYEMGLAKRTGAVQPGIVGVVGVDRSSFGGVSFVNNNLARIGSGSRFYYGAKGHIDVKIKGTAHWRTALQVTNAFNSDVSQVDVQVQTGLAFKF